MAGLIDFVDVFLDYWAAAAKEVQNTPLITQSSVAKTLGVWEEERVGRKVKRKMPPLVQVGATCSQSFQKTTEKITDPMMAMAIHSHSSGLFCLAQARKKLGPAIRLIPAGIRTQRGRAIKALVKAEGSFFMPPSFLLPGSPPQVAVTCFGDGGNKLILS
ncbi:MAG: hypothetical protein ACOZAN_00470 [Patescibacteria group bacterium]